MKFEDKTRRNYGIRSARSAGWQLGFLACWLITSGKTDLFADERPRASDTQLDQHSVLPILHLRCAACHGRQQKKGELDLRTVKSILKGSENGPVVVSGDPDASLLVQKISKGEMPPKRDLVKASVKPVRDGELETIRAWIAQGMPLTQQSVSPAEEVGETARQFWSFQPPYRPAVPRSGGLPANPIDAFIGRRLSGAGLEFALQASRRELVRRVYFNVTGLPPSPGEVGDFLDDSLPGAYERLIDRLLASPAYGEKWARHWLDLAGYADSEGIQHADKPRPWAYRYRNYVIRAFNSDKPYDRFLLEQIAGDELANYETESFTWEHYENLVATGFLRMVEDGTYASITNFVPDRQDTIDNEMRVLGSAVMGLTLHCAKCHSHKFDPILQSDYFRLRAVFKGAYDEHDWLNPELRRLSFGKPEEIKRWRENKASVDAEIAAIKAGDQLDEEKKKKAVEAAEKKRITRPMIRALWDRGEPSPTYVFRRGDYLHPGRLVEPGVPMMFSAAGPHYQLRPPWEGSDKTGRRLAFAKWLVETDHPLTARVMVNRLWKHHFGRGLVTTLDNFGTTGARSTHPELIDWLATELVARDWSIKQVQRLILTSRTYRQSSHVTSKQLEHDPGNRLWSRMELKRLEGETLRDSMLAVAGCLRREQFGPADPVQVSKGGLVMAKPENGTWRRSVYLQQRRTEVPTLLASFDLPVMSPNCIERPESTVATQALHLLNNELVRGLADEFARRIRAETGEGLERRLKAAFYHALGREPDTTEILAIDEKVRQVVDRVGSEPTGSGQAKALEIFCHALFNTAEFLYID